MPTALPVLVIEDDSLLSESLTEQLADWGFEPAAADTLSRGRALLFERDWTFVLLDLTLPDGSGMAIAQDLAARTTRPATIAVTGTATVEEAFQLARLGARAYLPKPLNVADLRETMRVLLEESMEERRALESSARAEVGSASYQDVTARVRRAMVDQALRLSGGSKTGAARILKVSRQAVQQLIRSLDVPERHQL